jgi:hypothetical protein
VWTVPTGDQPAVFRHEIHEPTKREFHRIEIAIDVGVIEFDVVNDRELGQVVHELRTFVEVSSVILVCFDDEIVTASDAKAMAEVLRDAADQKSGIQITLVHHPRGDARCRRLAVCARDGE